MTTSAQSINGDTAECTFHPVSIEDNFSVPELYAFHAKHSPNHPVFAYADLEANGLHDVTYATAWRDIRRFATVVASHCTSTESVGGLQERQAIGILALSDSLSYIYLMIAIMSLGHAVFPMSTRNTPVVTAHLLEKVRVTHVFISEDSAMRKLAEEANNLLAEKGLRTAQITQMISVMDSRINTFSEALEAGINEIADNEVTVILHSSGSTGYPKPIPFTRRGLANIARTPRLGEMDLTGKRIAAHTNPMFHAMGLSTILWPITSGAVFTLYKPVLPPVPPSPASFLENWVASRCNIIYCVPVFLEALARDPKNLTHMRALDCVVFCGAPVNKHLGDVLAQEGVVIHSFWGSTEAGPASVFIPNEAPSPYEWEYFRISKHIKFHMQVQENMDEIYEPVLIPTETWFPQVCNSELDGKPVYAVGDLLEQHPEDPERWRIFGRKDDQFALTTGENVNPLPIENTLLQDKNMATALLFGRGHFEVGVLISPATGVSIPEDDGEKQAEYIESIWPTIEKANSEAPKFANIDKKRIIVARPSKPLEYTPKGTARRALCLNLYAAEIEEVYQDERDASLATGRQFHDRI